MPRPSDPIDAYAAPLLRREFLRVGAAGLLGLNLPTLLRAATGKARAKSLVVVVLEGGPAHQDLWDMKPDAPVGIRGEFRPIETTVPGLHFCEHLPLLAKQAHHLALVRSVHHTIGDHNAGAYFALTGKEPVVNGKLITTPAADNFPPIGAVLARMRPSGRPLPDFVHVPDWMSNNGSFLPGQDAGFLGASADPFVAGDPSLPNYRVPGLDLPADLPLERVRLRRSLLDAIDHVPDGGESAAEGLDIHYRKAFSLISSPEARRAFDLSREPASVRERYGLDPTNPRKKEARQFGGLPHFGQCLLLARRLIESGVRVVTVCTGGPVRPGLGHPPRPLPPPQAVAPAHVRPRLLGLARRHERSGASRRDSRRRDGRIRPNASRGPDHQQLP